jgi:hypothetical protein
MSKKQGKINLENLKPNPKQMDILRDLKLYLELEVEKVKKSKKK